MYKFAIANDAASATAARYDIIGRKALGLNHSHINLKPPT